MAPSDYQTDPVTGRKVRWSNSKRAWVDRDGNVITTSQVLNRRAGESSSRRQSQDVPPQPRESGKTVRRGDPTSNDVETRELPGSLQQMAIAPRGSSSDVAESSTGARRGSSSQSAANVRSTSSGKRRDSHGDRARRENNLDRIRETGQDVRGGATEPSDNTHEVPETYKPRRVIEVLIGPQQPRVPFSVSRITPIKDYTGPLRRRRFVVLATDPVGQRFQAMAIKTNGGRGVAGEGIIKATSSVIYTNARYEILPEESPTRGPDGHIDSMQPQPIKVEAYDKTNALDPMARLDYCDVCEFSFDFPDIKLFGTIHQESRAALDAQYRNAWSKAQVRNPPAAVRSGQTSQPPLATSHNPGNPNSGPITDERLRKIFDDLKAYAKEKELTPPPTGLSQKQWDTLRDDSDTRAKFLGRINNKWLEELQSRRDSQEAGTAIEEEGAVHNTDDEDEESDEEE